MLIAEDDPDLGSTVACLMELAGFEVEHVTNGMDLVVRLDLAAFDGDAYRMPDAVVTDLRMPGCSGLDALLIMSDVVDATPCFILSGLCDEQLRERAASVGAEVMSKPFDADDLIERVSLALARGSSDEQKTAGRRARA